MTDHEYRCSICGAIVTPKEVKEHMAEEQAKPTWPGHMSFRLVGSEFDKEIDDA